MNEIDRMVAIHQLWNNGALNEEEIYWASKQMIAIATAPAVDTVNPGSDLVEQMENAQEG